MVQINGELEKNKVAIRARRRTITYKRKCFLNPSTGQVSIAYRFMVHLNSKNKMYRKLLKYGFQKDQPVWEDREIEDIYVNNTFEFQVMSREHENNCDAVLFAERTVFCTPNSLSDGVVGGCEDPYIFDAVAILKACSELTKGFDVYLRTILPLNVVYGMCKILKEEGRHDIVNLIGDEYPVVAYIADKKNQELYFGKIYNKNKDVDDFITYARDKVRRERNGRGSYKANIEILIPPIRL